MTWIWLLSEIECLSMGMDVREEISLGKLSTAGRVLTFSLQRRVGGGSLFITNNWCRFFVQKVT